MPLSSAGLLGWSCYFSTCAVHNVMFWPMRNSSFCWLSSTLPWTPSSTPTATRRWAQPSGRSSAASAVRTPAAPRKAPTARLPPSTTPSWLEFTAMTTLWFRKETQRRSQPSYLEGWSAPPDPNARQGVGCERERKNKLMYLNTNQWQYLFLDPTWLDIYWKLAYGTTLTWILPFESKEWRSCNGIRRRWSVHLNRLH